ncbi:MAG: GNAT family N-acetyltransferase [Alphaproteobacteria bacterium]|nr:GNAT family N-acetyltransferase [Alphaproteobacteria bacterium]
MEKFFELFKRDIKTQRLEMRILEPTIENAQLIWNVLKDENPDDYQFMWYSVSHKSHLTESVEETQQRMKLDFESKNGCAYYIFHNGKFVGYQRIHYWAESKTLQCASVWFIKSARGFGFNTEVHDMLEKMGFEQLHMNRICRQTMAGNLASKKSIEHSGYHLDGIDRQCNMMPDGTFMDHLLFSKLASEYNGKE